MVMVAHLVYVPQDVTFSIVPEGVHVRAVYLDADTGILTSPSSAAHLGNKTFVDCSTIDIATSLAVSAYVSSHLSARGVRFYDAPVSGGTAGAEAGTITFMVGAAPPSSSSSSPSVPSPDVTAPAPGTSQEVNTEHPSADAHFNAHIAPLLRLMGHTIVCVGRPGLGLAAKLSNNYLSGMVNVATAEAMNLGMLLGIDPRVLSEVFRKSSASNWVNSTSRLFLFLVS